MRKKIVSLLMASLLIIFGSVLFANQSKASPTASDSLSPPMLSNDSMLINEEITVDMAVVIENPFNVPAADRFSDAINENSSFSSITQTAENGILYRSGLATQEMDNAVTDKTIVEAVDYFASNYTARGLNESDGLPAENVLNLCDDLEKMSISSVIEYTAAAGTNNFQQTRYH